MTETRWYTGAGAPAALIEFVRDHTSLTFAGTADGRARGTQFYGLRFSAPDTGYATGFAVEVTAVADGTGSAARIDASAASLPASTGVRIPVAKSVDVMVERVGHPPVRTTLRGADAAALIEQLNSLPGAPNVAVSCRAFAGSDDLLTIGPIAVTIEVGGCASVLVRRAGKVTGLADPDGRTDALVLSLLHLPPGYGR